MFRDRLRQARKKANLSQEKLAALIGVQKSTVSGYETGYSEPDMSKIQLLMKVLNVDANYLWQDEMQGNSSEYEEQFSAQALAFAKEYDSISEYGKAVIRVVFEQENQIRLP